MTLDENPLLLQDHGLHRPPVRLRESQETLLDPSARWAVSLVCAARPNQTSRVREDRVWARLQAADAPLPPRLRQPRRLRLAFAATLVLVAGLFMSAAMAQWPGWLARAIRAASTEAPVRSPSSQAAEPKRSAPPPAGARQPAATQPLSVPEAPNSASRSRPPVATPEESQLLLEAMRALRVGGSPSRARSILATYLAHYPKGALAEEALVMLVEAAAAHGDDDAAALAARYFAQYPKGEFTDQVRRAVRNAPAAPK